MLMFKLKVLKNVNWKLVWSHYAIRDGIILERLFTNAIKGDNIQFSKGKIALNKRLVC